MPKRVTNTPDESDVLDGLRRGLLEPIPASVEPPAPTPDPDSYAARSERRRNKKRRQAVRKAAAEIQSDPEQFDGQDPEFLAEFKPTKYDRVVGLRTCAPTPERTAVILEQTRRRRLRKFQAQIDADPEQFQGKTADDLLREEDEARKEKDRVLLSKRVRKAAHKRVRAEIVEAMIGNDETPTPEAVEQKLQERLRSARPGWKPAKADTSRKRRVRRITDMIHQFLDREEFEDVDVPEGWTLEAVIVREIVRAATAGKQWALELIADRTDGKPSTEVHATIEHTNEDAMRTAVLQVVKDNPELKRVVAAALHRAANENIEITLPALPAPGA